MHVAVRICKSEGMRLQSEHLVEIGKRIDGSARPLKQWFFAVEFREFFLDELETHAVTNGLIR